MTEGTSISELFETDPLKLTREDIRPIVDYYRKARLQFKLGDKSAGATKKIDGVGKSEKKSSIDVELDI